MAKTNTHHWGHFLSNHNYTIAVSQKYLGHPPARLCRNADDGEREQTKMQFLYISFITDG